MMNHNLEMPGKIIQPDNLQGLSAQQVTDLRRQYGRNIFQAESSRSFIKIAWDTFKDPMFILLFIACALYFILGEVSEGIMMLAAMGLVAAISLYQEVKSTHALNALKQFTEPRVTVIRGGKELNIATEELVPGDIILVEEGMNIPADAIILQANDFTVNESIITGESLPADKDEKEEHNILYQGTTINSGKSIARVTATGNSTVLGKLGVEVGAYHPPKTLLQQQINRFVRRLAIFGLMGFFIIFLVNFLHHRDWATSLLFALTLAMSAVPEEIPVAFSSFMALGAFKMSKLGIISRQPQIVENLGAVSVICLDKTGTITENKMQVKTIYDFERDELAELGENKILPGEEVLWYAVLASETNPFDAMEKAIWEAWVLYTDPKMHQHPAMIHEYPLGGQPPMMTHVYEKENKKIIAAKGAVERVVRVCKLAEEEKKKILQHTTSLASKGYRVIGVAGASHTGSEFPSDQDDFDWQFKGLLALYDPPKKNISRVLKQFYDAKIDIKLITGDYPETAMNIAGQVGIPNHLKYVTGEQVMKMNDDELRETVKRIDIFARMFPDAKLKVIEALKANGEITAMTGDGVNDGPALKSADIGIAMGKRGTEIARQASDLILTDDNLERMVTAISEGRKIFENLKKAVRYIISIHIPIILTASMPLIFGWAYPNIFTPIHIIFLELIMGPTCSIFFENEPVEKTLMHLKPRERKTGLFTKEELLVSVVQGLIIATGALILYYYSMNNGASLEQTRTIVFTTLIMSNVFLTFANRSFTKNIYYTSRYKNNLAPFILIVSAIFLLVMHLVPAVRNLFRMEIISSGQFWLCFGVAFFSVMWFEVYKTGLLKLNSR
jgi:P-type Ca2+ transporter type 2C